MKKLVVWLTFYVALLAALLGVLAAVLPSTGNVLQGATGLRATAAGLLVAAAPGLALPFSRRAARLLLWAALAVFSGAALFAAFGHSPAFKPNTEFRLAAAAFAILAVIRVFLRRGRKSTS